MTPKTTAVVVRLPLSADQEETLFEISERDCLNSAIAAIGTPVAGGELEVEGYVRSDWREGWTMANGTDCRNILSDQKLETFSKALCDHDKAQAALAAAQAEIVRLRDALEDAKRFHEEQDKAISKQPPSAQGQWRRNQHQEQIESIEEALKGPAA